MRRNSTSGMGALHPIMFFMLIYGISLFLALFVCRTVYSALNEDELSASAQNNMPLSASMNATAYK